ncbi:hypothetical protein CONPUDRAFT_136895 [Coniophora puteana RWD-64-598 SS2]|uniref:t-SNARE coiled-coil homology domain-containing protein n=1 Tax=Coniophora puteana (strain RWD-64-598) TaxID=741705 RepID=A0A5M3MTH2_CONPW|nr:uncharacterized protein CONPUDRAFT_136895 [Coniophora puteana RWD-64-598 SS2]EIW82396.1 hypothetical protein CONPUDRAFT_136895 [Coniophora puteana RWD-64-598 SS2]
MAFSDRTAEFQSHVIGVQCINPPLKRRKDNVTNDAKDQVVFEKQYLVEAYAVLKHINTLSRMLSRIRKPYLNVGSDRVPLSRQGSRAIDIEDNLADIRYLSNEEREQVDIQARAVLSRCADRIKEMELLEKRRAELASSSSNPLSRFIPKRFTQDPSVVLSDFTAAHHSSITWYLSRRLTEAAQMQKDMQEERIKRQLERSRTLGSSAASEAMFMESADMQRTLQPEQEGWFNGASSAFVSGFAVTLGGSRNQAASDVPSSSRASSSKDLDDDDDDDIELSQSQILEFETENANILRSVQDTLESVQQAEARLMDISNLQMELVTHLTRQSELTDQLYEDAMATTSTVEKGNVQLREARRRAKDSRLYILVFLIGASLSLLFLHYY